MRHRFHRSNRLSFTQTGEKKSVKSVKSASNYYYCLSLKNNYLNIALNSSMLTCFWLSLTTSLTLATILLSTVRLTKPSA